VSADEHTRETVNIAFGRGEPARDRIETTRRDVKPAKVTLVQRIARWWDRQIGVDRT
jgi:hypothetical protein